MLFNTSVMARTPQAGDKFPHYFTIHLVSPDLERDLLALGKTRWAPLDLADVHEHIVAVVVR
jgi:hypothetical protein